MPIKTNQVISERSKTAPNRSINNANNENNVQSKNEIFILNRRKNQSASKTLCEQQMILNVGF